VQRRDKARSMYVTSSDNVTTATSESDRNGGVAKVPPAQVVTRDVPPAIPAARAVASQPAVLQRSDAVCLLCVVG